MALCLKCASICSNAVMGHAAAAGCAVIVNSDSEADELRALNEAAVNIAEEALAAAFSSRASNPTPRWAEGLLECSAHRLLQGASSFKPTPRTATCTVQPVHSMLTFTTQTELLNPDHQGCTAACVVIVEGTSSAADQYSTSSHVLHHPRDASCCSETGHCPCSLLDMHTHVPGYSAAQLWVGLAQPRSYAACPTCLSSTATMGGPGPAQQLCSVPHLLEPVLLLCRAGMASLSRLRSCVACLTAGAYPAVMQGGHGRPRVCTVPGSSAARHHLRGF